ncbi:uncharacterized protein LOC111033602 isoform X2 [Myzus persicae]|uniref:uncharacterized protein LOC111033602 isoform X2 n=1 Tax=Myzus persicae TaxID=13164 RepID=UPI000B935B53|nr:uncharacterized protein LOC111033602 isoform X2 [Myzus persicae]
MKKPASVFITLYLLLCTISGIICHKFDSCKSINEECSSDYDCCYEKCSFSLFSFRSYCNDNTNLYHSLKSYFRTKEQTGICSYTNNQVSETVSDGMFFSYSFNAAHAVLEPGTRVEVKLDDKKFIVTINNRPSQNNEVILEFSKETARALNIDNGGKIPCTISIVPELENNPYYKYLEYTLPYLALFTFLFRFFLV